MMRSRASVPENLAVRPGNRMYRPDSVRVQIW
jgi:hypothetical protein